MPAALVRRDVLKLGAAGVGAAGFGGLAGLSPGTALAQSETVNIVGAAATAGAARRQAPPAQAWPGAGTRLARRL